MPAPSRSGSVVGHGQGRAVLQVLGAVLSVQFGAALAVTIFVDVGPAGASALRLGAAALVLGVLVRPRLRGRSRRDLATAMLFGAALAGMNLSIYFALDRLPLGAAVTLEFIGPLGLSLLLSRRLRDVFWVVVAGLGVVLLGRGDVSGLDPVGVAFAVVAGIFWAGYILASAATGRRFPGLGGLALATYVAAVLILPVGITAAGPALLDVRVLVIGLGVGVLSSVLPYALELAALRRLAPRVFGVLMSLEPAVAALAGLVALGQVLAPLQWVAVGLVVIASSGVTLSRGR